MTAWHTIDTAPKDRPILAFARSRYYHADVYYGVAQWGHNNNSLPGLVAGWFWSFVIIPTHWQELPTPPDVE